MSRLTENAGSLLTAVASGTISKTLKAFGLVMLGAGVLLMALDGCSDTSWDESQDERLTALEAEAFPGE